MKVRKKTTTTTAATFGEKDEVDDGFVVVDAGDGNADESHRLQSRFPAVFCHHDQAGIREKARERI